MMRENESRPRGLSELLEVSIIAIYLAISDLGTWHATDHHTLLLINGPNEASHDFHISIVSQRKCVDEEPGR